MDGTGAIVDESSDEGGCCWGSRPLIRLRSDDAFVDAVSLDSGGSSEGSTPMSSCEREEMRHLWPCYTIYAYFEKEIAN